MLTMPTMLMEGTTAVAATAAMVTLEAMLFVVSFVSSPHLYLALISNNRIVFAHMHCRNSSNCQKN